MQLKEKAMDSRDKTTHYVRRIKHGEKDMVVFRGSDDLCNAFLCGIHSQGGYSQYNDRLVSQCGYVEYWIEEDLASLDFSQGKLSTRDGDLRIHVGGVVVSVSKDDAYSIIEYMNKWLLRFS